MLFIRTNLITGYDWWWSTVACNVFFNFKNKLGCVCLFWYVQMHMRIHSFICGRCTNIYILCWKICLYCVYPTSVKMKTVQYHLFFKFKELFHSYFVICICQFLILGWLQAYIPFSCINQKLVYEWILMHCVFGIHSHHLKYVVVVLRCRPSSLL